MRTLGSILFVLALVALAALYVSVQVYSLSTPEHYLEVKRMQWAAGGIAVGLFVLFCLLSWAWHSACESIHRWRRKR